MSDTSPRSASVMRRISLAFLTWRRHQQRRLVPFGITLKQLHVLRQLSRNEYLYPSQIAEMLFCDRPTATVVIRNMGKQGWVVREQDKQDRRQVRVILTDEGKTKLRQIGHSQRNPLKHPSNPLDCFTLDEVVELERLLDKLNERLRHITQPEKGATDEPTQ